MALTSEIIAKRKAVLESLKYGDLIYDTYCRVSHRVSYIKNGTIYAKFEDGSLSYFKIDNIASNEYFDILKKVHFESEE